MKTIFAIVLICVQIISIKCRVYDPRDEDEFDYVQMLDKRQLLSSSTHNHHRNKERSRREAYFKEEGSNFDNKTTKLGVNYTTHIFENDANNIAFVFWKSAYTDVIFILTCNNASTQTHGKLSNKGCHSQSSFYRSNNLGALYKKGDVKGTPFEDHQLHSIYLSPLNKSVIVITDYKKKVMFLTSDEGKTYTKISPGFAPTFVLFHPKNVKVVAAFDNFKKSLWMSIDGGKTWVNVMNNVRNYFWDEHRPDSLYVERDYSTEDSQLCHVAVYGEFMNNLAGIPELKKTSFKVEKLKQHLVQDSVYVGGGFILIQQTEDLELHIAKIDPTHDDLDFVKPTYSRNNKQHLHHVVLSSDNNELVLGIIHPDSTVTIYLSDELGKSFRHLIGNVVSEKFDTSVKSKVPKIDYYRVKGTKNTYIVNIVNNSTHISFNKGYDWGSLKYVDKDLNGEQVSTTCWPQKCFLNLYIKVEKQYMDYSAPMLSKDSAPGIIMAQGNIRGGEKQRHPINEEHKVWISIDGGRTWRMTLENNHGFALLDHGNFLAATPLAFNVKHNIHFSDNFGKTWGSTHYTEYQSRIAAIITDSTAKTLIINVFGFLYQQAAGSTVTGNTWIVWRFNFTNLFSRTCGENDYFSYPASAGSCVMGEKISFRRNRRHPNLTSTCYSPPELNTSYVVSTPCECKKTTDFECDDFYVYVPNLANDFVCQPISTYYEDLCNSDGYWIAPSGYRKLHGNKCTGGDEILLKSSKMEKCKEILPTRIEIKSSKLTINVGDTVDFEMFKHLGSYLTTYTWDFGDNINVSGTYKEMEKVKHTYNAQKQYTVRLIARNSGKSYTASLIIIAIDKTYHNAFIDYSDPAIAGKEITFMLQTLQRDGSRTDLSKQPATKFLWSFNSIYMGGTDSSQVKHMFRKVGTYMVEVQIITPVNTQKMYRLIRVFEDAYVIDFEFSAELETYNSGNPTWMHDFMYKFKMFLTIKYEIHDSDRLLVKGEAKKPTRVRAIICDTNDHMDTKRAFAIAQRIVDDVNKNKPFLYGYGKERVHVTKAQKVGFLEMKEEEASKKTSSKAWVYVFVVILIILAVLGGIACYRYRYRRRSFFTPYPKNDIMQKKLVFDVDEDFVGTEISDLPEDPH